MKPLEFLEAKQGEGPRLKERLGAHLGKMVFTNGCFDLLHAGHVTYLAEARSKGDFLVVAVNSDASVKRLKGPSRPLNTLKDRMTVLAALACVDYVTFFEENTPLSLIHLLKPQVLAKGGDWPIPGIVGAQEVLNWGGEVYSLPLVDGLSTTRLIEKAKEHRTLD